MQAILLSTLKLIATFASELGKRKKLFILIYHRVLNEPDFMRPGEVDRNTFTWQMQLLAKYFNVLPLSEALEGLQQNTLPPRAISITFDDGYADNYTNALPILKQFGLTATFFIASGYLDGGRMWNDTVIEAIRSFPQSQLDLSEIDLGCFDLSTPELRSECAKQIIIKIRHLDYRQRLSKTQYIEQCAKDLPDNLMLSSGQLKTLVEFGMEIGGHTVTHPILATLTDEQVMSEVKENKIHLETLLNVPIRLFAYPNGKPEQDYLLKHPALLATCGYRAAFSTISGVAVKSSDSWQLPRISLWDQTPVKFMFRLIQKYIVAPTRP